ncbi:MAG TPA: TIGR03032 family protein [Caulobacteraceae bacterium]
MAAAGEDRPWFSASPGLAEWLAQARVSIALTTYQSGKLFTIGLREDGRLAVGARSFGHCSGLAGGPQTLWMATRYQLWRLENVAGGGGGPHDRLYAPRLGYVTGAVNVHDIGVEADGGPVFVNTLFSCLARPSAAASFTPAWRPPFVSALAPEDRCHLNGLAMRDGRSAFVTACAASDEPGGWRGRRADGGVAIEVDSGAIVLEGLSMPHSPRWHEGRLWLLNSGAGELGFAEPEGRFRPVRSCPGFARGLDFAGGCAVVGLSKATRGRGFEGLRLEAALQRGEGARCGFDVVDAGSGAPRAWFRFEGVVDEVYDVVCLHGVMRPAAVGLKTSEVERVLNIGAA